MRAVQRHSILGGMERTLGPSIGLDVCVFLLMVTLSWLGWGPKATFFRPEDGILTVAGTTIVVLVRRVIGLGHVSKHPMRKITDQHTGLWELWIT